MALFLVIFLFLLPSVSSESCAGQPDGHYEVSCRSYIVCNNGVPTLIHCEDPPATNTVYNNVTKQCDSPHNVGPPCGDWRDCSNQANGKYPDLYNNCTSYYTCHEGVFFGHNYCNPGLVYDSILGICNWPINVHPPCGTLSP